jgi:hypothetical protein
MFISSQYSEGNIFRAGKVVVSLGLTCISRSGSIQSALINKTSAAVFQAGCRQDHCSKVELSIPTLMHVHISSAFIHAKANEQNTMV